MIHNSSDFYVILPSSSHAGEKTGDFKVRLPRVLQFPGRWEVGMTSMIYPVSWHNVPATETLNNDIVKYRNELVVTLTNGMKVSVRVKAGHYTHLEDLVDALNTELHNVASAQYEQATRDFEQLYEPKQEQGKGTWSHPESEKTNARAADSRLHWHQKAIQFTKKPHRDIVTLTMDANVIAKCTLSRLLAYVMGYGAQSMEQETSTIYPPDMRGGMECFYVYSNICAYSIVGPTVAPILRIVHCSGQYGQITEKLFDKPHYTIVGLKETDFISIQVRDDAGEIVKFEFGKTIIKLHFRKRRFALE